MLEMGVEGIKADDGEGYYSPPTRGSPTAAAASRRPGSTATSTARAMQEALDEVHPGDGVLFGRSGWTGQQATGLTWGGDQVSDCWSLRDPCDGKPDRRGQWASRTGPTTSAAISASASRALPAGSCWSAGRSSAASRR